MNATPEANLTELKPLAAVIEQAIQTAPIRLGTDDWGTVLAANVLAHVAAYMGRTLGPDAPILAEVQAERERQDAKWGEQNHPDGTGGIQSRMLRDEAQKTCQAAAERGTVTWLHIADEEHCEALAESDPVRLRAELVQAAAVYVAWIAAIDRRAATPA